MSFSIKIQEECTDMSSIDSFLFTAEIIVLFVANRQWSMSLYVLALQGCGRLVKTNDK